MKLPVGKISNGQIKFSPVNPQTIPERERDENGAGAGCDS
jgi:hypothetical protein